MLEKLRAKPEHIKKRISLAFTLVIFVGIVFVWISSWGARQDEGAVREKTASPIASFGTMIDGLVLSAKEMISGAPSYMETNGKGASSTVSTSTPAKGFDLSGVVILDSASPATTSVKK